MTSEPYAGYFSTVDSIVDEITNKIGVSPDLLMLVGAFCRDLLHHRSGVRLELRRTSDTDFGIAIDDWDVQSRIDASFPRVGGTGIRYAIANHTVDLMPFGEIEDPEGTSTPPRRSEGFSVFGFQDVFTRATDLVLPTAGAIKIPTAPGYAALKLAAWLDRHPYGATKDASDIAVIISWYTNRQDLIDELYGSDTGLQLLERFDYDPDHAAIGVLARDIADCLAPQRQEELKGRLKSSNISLMANYLSIDNTRVNDENFAECLRRVQILTDI